METKERITVTIDREVLVKFRELKWEKRKSLSEMVEELIKASLGGLVRQESKKEDTPVVVSTPPEIPKEQVIEELRSAISNTGPFFNPQHKVGKKK